MPLAQKHNKKTVKLNTKFKFIG